MNVAILQGLIRHLIGAIGGFLVSKGYMDGGMVEGLAGAASVLAASIWSVIQKKQDANASVPVVPTVKK